MLKNLPIMLNIMPTIMLHMQFVYDLLFLMTRLQVNVYAKQKHLGCKKRRGQSEAAVI